MESKEQIKAFISSNFYVPEGVALEDGSSLLDQGIVDSTGVLEVVAFLESTFGIKVEDQELLPENLDSIQRLADFVARKKGK
jgi:acyl carrier protein